MKHTHTYRLLLVIFLFTTTYQLQAQSDSLEVHVIKGKQYYIHVVEKGESLYFIHKKYNVPLAIIKKENPSVADGLSIGERIIIPLKKEEETADITDGNYLTHEVKKKQTLYSIAKLYKVKQKDVIAANPEVENGLKEGQIIRIPVVKLMNKKRKKTVNERSPYQTHAVKKGETLYSLSKLYDTTVDSIKLVNDGLKQGLKLGEIIYVPKKAVQQSDAVNSNKITAVTVIGEMVQQMIADTIITSKKPVYNIGLMLPFYLDENDEMTRKRSVLKEKTIYPKSKFAIEFYKGFIVGLDSISTDSCKFKVYVYDTKGNDTNAMKKILLNPVLKKMDLLVGPLYYNNFKKAAVFAKENQIPIVSPVKQSNKMLLGNQYVFKAIPSKSTTMNQLCQLVVDSFKTENLMAIVYEKSKEKGLVDLYIETYNNLILEQADTTIYGSIKTLKINYNIGDIIGQLHSTKNNVIYVPASNQTFITNLFSQLTTVLNKKSYQNYRITLIGMEEWLKYENIDLAYFQILNVHYSTSRHVNLEDTLTTQFITNYEGQTKTYPTNNALLGFDLAHYFGTNFKEQGSLFTALALEKKTGLSINFNFFKTGIESGFENTNSYLIRFKDFALEKIE